MRIFAVIAVLALCGCKYDPISGPPNNHPVRPDPFGVSNRVSFNSFMAVPVSASRPLLPEKMIASFGREITPLTNNWEFRPVLGPVKTVPSVVITSGVQRLEWQASPGFYRVLVVSNGLWIEDSFTVVLQRPGWLQWPVSVIKPTNNDYKVVSP